MNPVRIIHNNTTFFCELSHACTLAPAPGRRMFWFLDIIKYHVNDGTNSEQVVCSGRTRANCLSQIPVAIKQLTAWGLPVDKACDLVADAVGGSKVVENQEPANETRKISSSL